MPDEKFLISKVLRDTQHNFAANCGEVKEQNEIYGGEHNGSFPHRKDAGLHGDGKLPSAG